MNEGVKKVSTRVCLLWPYCLLCRNNLLLHVKLLQYFVSNFQELIAQGNNVATLSNHYGNQVYFVNTLHLSA